MQISIIFFVLNDLKSHFYKIKYFSLFLIVDFYLSASFQNSSFSFALLLFSYYLLFIFLLIAVVVSIGAVPGDYMTWFLCMLLSKNRYINKKNKSTIPAIKTIFTVDFLISIISNCIKL